MLSVARAVLSVSTDLPQPRDFIEKSVSNSDAYAFDSGGALFEYRPAHRQFFATFRGFSHFFQAYYVIPLSISLYILLIFMLGRCLCPLICFLSLNYVQLSLSN